MADEILKNEEVVNEEEMVEMAQTCHRDDLEFNC